MNEILPKNDDSLWKVIKKLIILLLAIGLLALIYANVWEATSLTPGNKLNKLYHLDMKSDTVYS